MTDGEEGRLVALIELDPSRPDGYGVLADWLQERGDPRGALIAEQIARPADRAVQAALARGLPPALTEQTWWCGFLRSVKLDVAHYLDPRPSLRGLAQHPAARFLEALHLDADPDSQSSSYQPALDALVELGAPATLRHLSLDSATSSGQIERGGLTRLGATFPALRTLTLHASLSEWLGELAFPAVTALDVGSWVMGEGIDAILSGAWPSLARLRVESYLGAPSLEKLAPLVGGSVLPSLRHLALHRIGEADTLADALAPALLARLDTLDLSRSRLSRAAARRLRARFPGVVLD